MSDHAVIPPLSQPSATNTADRKLLLVDADPLLQWSVKTLIGRRMEVIAAKDFAQADAALNRSAFDVLIVSADQNGTAAKIETHARVRNPDVQVVYLTIERRANGLDPHVAYLEKPFRLDVLMRLLHLRPAAKP